MNIASFKGESYDDIKRALHQTFIQVCLGQDEVKSGHVFATVHLDACMQREHGPDCDQAIHCATMQSSMKKGIKQFGERAIQGIHIKLSQLHLCDSFQPINHKNLTKEQHNKVLESHLFLKEKRIKELKE